jgi:hypothetical protein
MTGVHIYDPSDTIIYRHTDTLSGYAQARMAEVLAERNAPDDVPSHDETVLALIDRHTGERVYTLPARELRIGGLLLPR